MLSAAIGIAEGFVAAYAARDVERAASFLADDVVLALHVDREVMPFGGVTIGKAQVLRRWELIAGMFEMPLYRLEHAAIKGIELHTRVAYLFRHIGTGEEIDGHMRHVINIRKGLIARANEYHDRARVEAFFRLIGSKAGS